MIKQLIQDLNAGTAIERLKALTSLVQYVQNGEMSFDEGKDYVNNHIHTIYSFSPYSPSKAIWMAKLAGLRTAGIIDHDSINGAEEFIVAGKLLDMPTTIGIECRVSMKHTPFHNRRINHTDQTGIAYVAMHGIPHTKIQEIEVFMRPYLEKRNLRNRKMIDKINALFPEKIVDFDADVRPISQSHEGGSITERHLLFALSINLMKKYGKGQGLVTFLVEQFGLEIKGKALDYLLDLDNPHYSYDLLGVLKGHFVSKFYIDADEECLDVTEFIAKAKEVGAISAYAYLGDLKNSVTGDKRDDQFEDDYIDELFDYLKKIGFNAVTYMPSRNTPEQLERVRKLCNQHKFFEISGEDINSPRQSFICEALLKEEFNNLITATWAMIGHEVASTEDASEGLFSHKMIEKYPMLGDRVTYYFEIGKKQETF
ncbi:MAG: PHP domain-containing protein [Firmicutes bacterium HGW-Firmicutes-7]|nr:MAG: PHP domain-containing protein [Firmicutes bacterium HGW-Firmicutes-7]